VPPGPVVVAAPPLPFGPLGDAVPVPELLVELFELPPALVPSIAPVQPAANANTTPRPKEYERGMFTAFRERAIGR
jgi:hypothetical protein